MGDCQTSSDRSISQGQPVIEYLEFQVIPFPFPGGVNYDIPLAFKKPRRCIGVASIRGGNKSCNIYLHFTPTGKNNATGVIEIKVDGTENWLPLFSELNVGGAGSSEGRFVVFTKPVQKFFISTDHPNGGVGAGLFITLFGSDDFEDAILERT